MYDENNEGYKGKRKKYRFKDNKSYVKE